MPAEELLEYILAHCESEFVEFKHNNFSPDNIGELVSALANGAVLEGKDEAYLVFGVDDNKNVVGTSFDPDTFKRGKQPFKIWLTTNLKNADPLDYITVDHDLGRVVIVVIKRAKLYPVKFMGVEYIRVGEAKKRLSEHPELARKLWEKILQVSFEDGNASDLVTAAEVFDLLDVDPYYRSREVLRPNEDAVLNDLCNEGIITKKLGRYFITNMGALLFAREFSSFPSLENRGIRLIKYRGNDKMSVERSLDGHRGYALGMLELLSTIHLLLPREEYVSGGKRSERQVFPDAVIRELTVNMAIHQDFSMSGYAPRVEIYNDRIEFSNTGTPVIDVAQFLNSNKSRNPRLAKLMRTLHLCEERGMGIDIVEDNCEQHYLPSLSVITNDGFTRVTVFDHKTLRQFSGTERTNLVYMHACLQFARHTPMTNETLRSRFADGVISPTVASRWINEALEKGLIKPFDPDSKSRKYAQYIPAWA